MFVNVKKKTYNSNKQTSEGSEAPEFELNSADAAAAAT